MSQKQSWEEDLETYPTDWRCIVRKGTDEVVADVRVPPHENGREVAEMLAASSAMTRCLRSVLTKAMDDPRLRAMLGDELVDEMRRALHKAGAMR